MIVVWGAILGTALWLATGELFTPGNLILLAIGLVIGIYMRIAEPAGFKWIVWFGVGILLLVAVTSDRLAPVAAAADIEYRTLIGGVGLSGVAVVALSLLAYIYSWGERRDG